MKTRLGVVFALAALLALPALAASTLTGTIRGTVVDDKGEPVVGATINLRSPALVRERAIVTDAQGNFFAASLPAGDYAVTARLDGYVTIEITTHVEVDKTTPVALTLNEGEISETVTVTADRPIVDRTATDSTSTYEKDFTEQLPVGRSELSLLTFAPGVTDPDGDGNANFLGGTSNSNQYLVDGVSYKDPVTGTFGANLNYDAIETVDIKLAGISAEYGQLSGGLSSVVLKSGGNEFTGSFRDLITSPSWQKNFNSGAASKFSVAPTAPVRGQAQKNHQITTTLGGPVLVDSAWFFLSYDRIENATVVPLGNPVGGVMANGQYIDTFDGDFGLAKFTWQATNNHRLQYTYSEDPAVSPRCYATLFLGTPCYESYNVDNQTQGGYLWTANWNATWTPTFLTDFRAGRYKSQIVTDALTPVPVRPGLPLGSNGLPALAIDLGSFYTFDAPIFSPDPDNRDRKQYELTSTKFLDTQGLGTHTIKIGADYEESINPSSTNQPGDGIFYFFFVDSPPGVPGTQAGDAYDVNNRIYYLWYSFAPSKPATPKNQYTALFVNDDWQLNGHLAFNLGLRVERSKNTSDIGEQIINQTDFAPRLGAAFDVGGDGRHVIKATASRYLAGVNLSTLGPFTRTAGGNNVFDLFFNTNFPNPGLPTWTLIASGGPDPDTQRFDTGIAPQHIDEYTLGYEFLLSPTLGVSLRGIHRDWSNTLSTITTYDYSTGSPRAINTLENNDGIKRNYKALVLGIDKRYSNNFQLNGSYTWSRAEGNATNDQSFDSFGQYAGVPQVTQNRFGLLPWDVTHAIKLQGFYQIPLKSARHALSVGSVFNYASGTPFAANRSVTVVVGPGADGVQDTPLGTLAQPGVTDADQTAANVLEFLEPRGSRRIESAWQLDLSMNYRFHFSKNVAWESRFNVYNVTDQYSVLAVNTQFQPGGANTTFGFPTTYGQLQNPRTYELVFAVTW